MGEAEARRDLVSPMNASDVVTMLRNTVAKLKQQNVPAVSLPMIENWISELNRKIDRRAELEEENKKRVAHWEHVLGSEHTKAHQYRTVVIVAGYAAYFGVWNSVRQILTARETLWCMGFLLSSFGVFVFFEVWHLVHATRSLKLRSRIFEGPVEEFESRRAAAQTEADRFALSKSGGYWVQVWLTTIPGLIATLGLGLAIVRALLRA